MPPAQFPAVSLSAKHRAEHAPPSHLLAPAQLRARTPCCEGNRREACRTGSQFPAELQPRHVGELGDTRRGLPNNGGRTWGRLVGAAGLPSPSVPPPFEPPGGGPPTCEGGGVQGSAWSDPGQLKSAPRAGVDQRRGKRRPGMAGRVPGLTSPTRAAALRRDGP